MELNISTASFRQGRNSSILATIRSSTVVWFAVVTATRNASRPEASVAKNSLTSIGVLGPLFRIASVALRKATALAIFAGVLPLVRKAGLAPFSGLMWSG